MLALVSGLAIAAPAASSASDGGNAVVREWVTSADQTKLLAQEPDQVFAEQAALAANIEVDESRRYQEIVGFGAAFTDASAWLIQNRMSRAQRSSLLHELFGPAPGIGLSFTRLSIGASDFSRSHYSLDDPPPGARDSALAYFSINPNRADLLPLLRTALSINPKLRIMASPWSAPAWMKSTGSMIGGTLRPDAYSAFSQYLWRYVDAYQSAGLPIFALTVQNEPHFEPADYPGMRLDAAARARLIGEILGPLFAQKGVQTRILDWDHNWNEPDSPMRVLADPVAARYIAGVAWHCYEGNVQAQTLVHDAYPDKETYLTECSGGGWKAGWREGFPWFMHTLIIGATRNWAKGVLLWNLALDVHHGPHAGGCTDCQGVVTIDPATGAVTRNLEYYALAHASRFVRPGAQRIESTHEVLGLESVAFRNADDGSMALIVLNRGDKQREFSVRAAGAGFRSKLAARSVATFTWRPNPPTPAASP